jgi:iron complex transport system ATP-binding protein
MTDGLVATDIAIEGRLATASLAVPPGRLVGLVGPNGSGKTSLLHALAGIGAAEGEVRIGGVNPRHLGPQHRQRLFAYLPASRDLKWPLAARDLIGLALPPASNIEEVVRRLELTSLLDRRVDQLSTGERSRVLIGRALAADPELLLLDEPTANLDPLWQLRLMEYLRELVVQRGKIIVLAVHDLETARSNADRLLIMNEGRIAADGDPRELLEGPLMSEIFGIEWTPEGWRAAV